VINIKMPKGVDVNDLTKDVFKEIQAGSSIWKA
jgi:hypothetical protein